MRHKVKGNDAVTDTRSAINALRQHIAALSDLLRLAAQCGQWDTHKTYEIRRRQSSGELNGAVEAALDNGTLTRQEAARALSPIASLETADVF